MNVLFLTTFLAVSSAEICIRFLMNRDEERIFQRIPGRVWRWNGAARRFEQIEATKMNGSIACSVEMASSLRGKTILAAMDIMHPYVLRRAEDGGATGFIGDAWTILEESMGFKTIYRKAGPSASQTLMNGQTHALLVPAVVYSDTSGYYAYSTPITSVSYALFVRSDGTRVPGQWYAYVFSQELWLAVLIFALITALAIASVQYLKKFCRANRVANDREFSSASFHLLVVVGSLCGQGCQRVPASWSLRAILLSHLITGMLLAAGFSSTLTSYTAIRGTALPLTGLEDALRKRTHSVCVRNDSSAYIRFTVDGSPRGELKKRWKNLVNARCPDMRNVTELESRLCAAGFAYLEVPDVFLPIYRRAPRGCRIVQTPNRYWPLKISFLHARYAQHREAVNARLIRLHSSGIFKYLEKKWMPKGIRGTDADPSIFHPVEYDHVHLLLLGFACAAILSILICILENVCHALRPRERYRLDTARIA